MPYSNKSSEIIKLPTNAKNCIRFMELPHGEWLLTYIDGLTNTFQFLIKNGNSTPWIATHYNNPINQVKFNNRIGKIESFTQFFDHKGDLIMVFSGLMSEGQNHVWSQESHNYGKNWSDPREISSDLSSWIPWGSPVILLSGASFGHIVLPMEDKNINRALLVFTPDNGKIWNFSLYIEPMDKDFESLQDDIDFSSLSSTAPRIIEDGSGNIRLFCWFKPAQCLISMVSSDLGSTWMDMINIDLPLIFNGQAYDICLINVMNQKPPQRIALIAEQKIKEEQYLVFYTSSCEKIDFSLDWREKILMNLELIYCQIFQDSHGEIHLCYALSDKLVHHIILNNEK